MFGKRFSMTTPVRYDPRQPEHAVLETGQMGVTRRILAGSLIVGIGVAAIVFAVFIAGLPTG
jgi:hypothetical protein